MSDIRRIRQQITQELDQFLLSYFVHLKETVPDTEARKMLAQLLQDKQVAYGTNQGQSWDEKQLQDVRQQLTQEIKEATTIERAEIREQIEAIRTVQNLMKERVAHA